MAKFKDCLIVDDDDGICEVLKMYCENLGVFRNILVAKDGITASNMIHNQKFSLILLDINMPKKLGTDIIAKDFKGTGNPNSVNEVIIVSGDTKQDVIKGLLEKGIRNFLVKPFDEAAFQAKVLSVLKANLEAEKAASAS